MQIGFDAKRAFYNKSGLGNYSRDTILSLVNYFPDNNYHLYTPQKKNPFNFIQESENVKIIKPEGINKLYQSYWRSISLGGQLNKDKLDIYHGLSNELPANINHAETRSIVTIHDLIFMRYPELYKSVDREIYQQKFFEACLAADMIIAISKQTKQDIISFFHIPENKIEVIYQGCNPIFYKKRGQDEINSLIEKYKLPANFVLNVGTLEKRKNALQVLHALKLSKINIPIVFVGKSTNYIRDLHTFVRENKMEEQVIFLHNVQTEELPTLYQAARIFIYPSIFEGFGIPILEALNSGTPVITNKYGCFMESGGDAAIYINPNHPEEIGEAINEILNHPEKEKQMIEKGFEYAKHFKQKLISKKLFKLYQSII